MIDVRLETFKPYGPWIMIKPDKRVTEINGILLPQESTEQKLSYGSGKVLAVGQGQFNNKRGAKAKFIPHDVGVGQTIVYRDHLKYLNTLSLNSDICLVHVQDVIGELIEGKLIPSRVHG